MPAVIIISQITRFPSASLLCISTQQCGQPRFGANLLWHADKWFLYFVIPVVGFISLRSVTLHKEEQGNRTVGRALLAWRLPPLERTQRIKQSVTLRWHQIDPVTQLSTGSSSRRLITWPQSLIPGSEAEFLISVDGLIVGSTYKFVFENSSSPSVDSDRCKYGNAVTVSLNVKRPGECFG